jgi:hypothetical protein
MIEHADCLAIAVPHRQGAGDKRGRFLLVAGEDSEMSPAPLRIGESGSDRMPSI